MAGATVRISTILAALSAALLVSFLAASLPSQQAQLRAHSLLGVENGVRPSDLAMPWLNVYDQDSKLQQQEDAKFASEGEPKVTEPKPDPLWCGAGACAEYTYSRFAHYFAHAKAHLTVNEAALKAPPSLSEANGGTKHFWALWAANREKSA
mmetsp:Transcript_15660/g.31523  ORF Transcript_15660/g.31523 Transcript_15660/m.31523 type:complete len:152 (+) Transcript_15660:26-481(+)